MSISVIFSFYIFNSHAPIYEKLDVTAILLICQCPRCGPQIHFCFVRYKSHKSERVHGEQAGVWKSNAGEVYYHHYGTPGLDWPGCERSFPSGPTLFWALVHADDSGFTVSSLENTLEDFCVKEEFQSKMRLRLI